MEMDHAHTWMDHEDGQWRHIKNESIGSWRCIMIGSWRGIDGSLQYTATVFSCYARVFSCYATVFSQYTTVFSHYDTVFWGWRCIMEMDHGYTDGWMMEIDHGDAS